MGKSTISMAIFNSYVSLPEGKLIGHQHNMLLQYVGFLTLIPWTTSLKKTYL